MMKQVKFNQILTLTNHHNKRKIYSTIDYVIKWDWSLFLCTFQKRKKDMAKKMKHLGTASNIFWNIVKSSLLFSLAIVYFRIYYSVVFTVKCDFICGITTMLLLQNCCFSKIKVTIFFKVGKNKIQSKFQQKECHANLVTLFHKQSKIGVIHNANKVGKSFQRSSKKGAKMAPPISYVNHKNDSPFLFMISIINSGPVYTDCCYISICHMTYSLTMKTSFDVFFPVFSLPCMYLRSSFIGSCIIFPNNYKSTSFLV